MFEARLRKMARHHGRWARRQGIACYRIYDRDVPGYPLAVDVYDGSVHAQVYERAKGRVRTDPEGWLAEVGGAIERVLEVPKDRVFFKARRRQRDFSQYQRVARTGAGQVVEEAGHRFWVNLADHLDTGLFLDHRQTRQRVAAEADGARFLNLYAYTGSFTVYAAAAGARSTTTVDLSRRYLAWAERNLALNDLAGPAHRFESADCVAWLADAAARGERYDLIVCDPPTFSRSKRMRGVFDVQKHHPALLAAVERLLSERGVLYFSTNFRRFRLDPDAFAGLEAKEITKQTIPPDFRDKRIHRCWRAARPA